MTKPSDDKHTSPEEERLLAAFSEGLLSQEELSIFESLLEKSPWLRDRLDQESGFVQISDALPDLKTPLSSPSGTLKKAIDSLLSDTNEADIRDGKKLKTERLSQRLMQTQSGITLRHRIGRGGMGEVFEGYDPQLDRSVAVKVLPTNLLDDPVAHERLFREAQAAAQLHHENIVAVHSIQQINDQWCLVQQLVPGESLQERLDRDHQLPWDDLQKLALHLARGLAAAHRRKIIHRDLKPSNILLDSEAHLARIADFGLAKRQSDQGLTTEGTVAGTPCFMSPEQAQAQELTPQSDLFSLGSVLYVAASGKLPFSGDNAYVILDQIRTKNPPSLKSLRSDLPDWFCQLASSLLEKDLKHRIASAEAVIEIIQNQSLPVSPNSHSKRTRPMVVAILATLASLVVLIGGYSAWLAARPSTAVGSGESEQPSNAKSIEAPAVSQKPFHVSGIDRSFDSFNEAVATAEDGSTVVVQSDGPFLVEPVNLGRKKLSIIAAPGRRPIIRSLDVKGVSLAPFISTRTDLLIQGLNIDWPIETESKLDVLGQAIIVFDGDKLSISDCRLKCGKGASCIQCSSGLTILSNSHLISVDGNCVVMRYGVSNIRGTNVFLEAKNAVILVSNLAPTPNPTTSEIVLQQSSIVADRFLTMVTHRPPQNKLSVKLDSVVFDCSSMCAVIGALTIARDSGFSNNFVSNFASLATWQDRNSVYKRGTTFLSFSFMRQPLQTIGNKVTDLQSWKSLFNEAMNGSVEASITTDNLTTSKMPIHHVSDASGTILEPCGIDPTKLP